MNTEQPKYEHPIWQSPHRKHKRFRWFWALLSFFAVVLILAIVACGESTPSSTSVAPQTTPVTSKPIHYPPTTEADLRGLAAKGDASAIDPFHSESVGATGVCPQPKRLVTVDPHITGQQLAEDLLAYFYTQQLNNSCGSVVFAYHKQSEANEDSATNGAYTAGRVMLDVTDSSGSANMDPNATNLKHQLTLDTGGDLDTGSQEYVVNY